MHGRRIELATLDDGGDAKRALANTQRLAEQLRVFALLAYPEPEPVARAAGVRAAGPYPVLRAR